MLDVAKGAEEEGGPRLDDATGMAAVRAAYDAGYTLFDHSDIYGRGECERIFGKVLLFNSRIGVQF